MSAKIFDWLSKNSMKSNAEKCHLLLSENTKHVAFINHIQIENNILEKLPGVTIDSDSKFDIYVNKSQLRGLMLLHEFQDIWIQVRKEL